MSAFVKNCTGHRRQSSSPDRTGDDGDGDDYRKNAKRPTSPLTEEDLRGQEFITPSDVMRLTTPCRDYLCPLESNVYEIDFTRFRIRDTQSSRVLFEVTKPPGAAIPSITTASGNSRSLVAEVPQEENDNDADDEEEPEDTDIPRHPPHPPRRPPASSDDDANSCRFVRYQFPSDFLDLKTVGATIEFSVGTKSIKKFRMIENHFFRDHLLKTFDFEFGFCIPNSKNSCEHIYEFPTITPQMKRDMVDHPFETKSDSFYFVDDKLIMHNRAEYGYDGVDSTKIL